MRRWLDIILFCKCLIVEREACLDNITMHIRVLLEQVLCLVYLLFAQGLFFLFFSPLVLHILSIDLE